MRLPHRLLERLSAACLLGCALLLAPLWCAAQGPSASASPLMPASSWKQLGAREKAALAPLAERWHELSEAQRIKWRAIAQNFDQMPAADQQLMQTRMKEWVALSPAQRNQARLNFNSLQNLSKDQKKTRWDEYQALSEEEKRKLSAGALAPAKTAAPSARPMPSDRLVQPALRSVPPAALPPRAPIDQKTLLPVPTAPAPVPASAPSPATVPASAPAAAPADSPPAPAPTEPAREASSAS